MFYSTLIGSHTDMNYYIKTVSNAVNATNMGYLVITLCYNMAVLTIYGRVLLAMSSPRHELLTVVTVRPVCICTHTPSCSIVQKETTWGR